MKVHVVDPPAYTPPYDRSLCGALARAGVDVELITTDFAHGSVPDPEAYTATSGFYRRSAGRETGGARRVLRGGEHLLDMLRYRRSGSRAADVVHFQWLTVPGLDASLLPRHRPLVQTPHGLLRAEAWRPRRRAAAYRRLLQRMDGLVALSEYGAAVLREEAEIAPERIHVIPHGPLDYLTRLEREAPLAPELDGAEGPVVLFFGLLRPYKGLDLLLEAFREVSGAELWIVGRPFGIDTAPLEAAARRCEGTVRLVPRFVADEEVPAIFRRADLVVLPHRDAEQSGVLFTALAFGKAILMSDVGGFPEVAANGAGRTFPSGDAEALASALAELIADADARARLAAAAAAAASGQYSWDEIAAKHVALYERLLRP